MQGLVIGEPDFMPGAGVIAGAHVLSVCTKTAFFREARRVEHICPRPEVKKKDEEGGEEQCLSRSAGK